MRFDLRVGLFASVGVAFFVHWLSSDPSYDVIRTEWRFVVGFSGVLLLLAVAVVVFASMTGGAWSRRLSLLAGLGLTAGSVSNVVEDGLGQGWAFYGFVGALAVTNLSLLGLATVLAVGERGRRRLLGLVPAGTLCAIVFYVPAGGILMLVTWVGAAAGAALTRSQVGGRHPGMVPGS